LFSTHGSPFWKYYQHIKQASYDLDLRWSKLTAKISNNLTFSQLSIIFASWEH
jgi:hypothetical protein